MLPSHEPLTNDASDLPPVNGGAAPGPVVAIEHLSKSYGDNLVLKDMNLTVARGEVVSIIGPSGVGKSTLLRCINLLERPNSGRIVVQGRTVWENGKAASSSELVALRRTVGMLFQSFNLFPHLTAVENVAIGLTRGLGQNETVALEQSLHLLDRVGLRHKALSFPGRLSGGEQQRVAIARALALEPAALLFDEPTSSLDPELATEVLAVMRELSQTGMTMMVVTHELAFARDVSDRIVFVDAGDICEEGPPEKVLQNPTQPRTQAFLARFRGST